MIEMKSRPRSRAEFERNMNMLSESFFKKTIQINASLHRTIQGIQKTRVLPNQRVNLLTVDESSRLQANTIANFSMMRNELSAYD